MKNLNQYLSENLKTGRQVLEKFQVSKEMVDNMHNNDCEFIFDKSIKVPNTDVEAMTMKPLDDWKTVKIPSTKYVVYADQYHRSRWHLATTFDMCMMTSYYADYEDFVPENDIILASNSIEEIIEAYVEFVLEKGNATDDIKDAIRYLQNKDDQDNFADLMDANRYASSKVYDSWGAIHSIYHGDELMYDYDSFNAKDLYNELDTVFDVR